MVIGFMIVKCVGDECMCCNICLVGVFKVECVGFIVENCLYGVFNFVGFIGVNNCL